MIFMNALRDKRQLDMEDNSLHQIRLLANMDITHDGALYLRIIGKLLLEKRWMEEKLMKKDFEIGSLYNKCMTMLSPEPSLQQEIQQNHSVPHLLVAESP